MRRPRPVSGRPTTTLVVFFLPALLMLGAAAALTLLNGIWGIGWGRWPILHLALLGGVSQLVVGAAQFFVAAFLSTDPPPRWLIAAQVLSWNAGAIMVVSSRPLGNPAIAEWGAALIGLGILLFVAGMLRMRQRSLQSYGWATRWYFAAAGFLALGVLSGAAMITGATWQSGSLLGSHVIFNVFGWFGTAIVGTLHTLVPSLCGTRLRHPKLEGPAFVSWVAGVAALGSSFAFGADPLSIAGWTLLLLSSGFLAANLISSFAVAERPWKLSLLLIAAGQVFLVQGSVAALGLDLGGRPTVIAVGEAREVLPVLFLAGWVGLTVAGSLLHLMPMLARVRSGFRFPVPVPSPVGDRRIAIAAAGGMSLMAIAAALGLAELSLASKLVVVAALLTVGWRLAGIARVAFAPPRRFRRSGDPEGRLR